MITIPTEAFVWTAIVTMVVMLGSGAIEMVGEHLEAKRERLARPWFDPDALDGPPPWDASWTEYVRDLEHSTIRPVGLDPNHCELCLGYAVSMGRQLQPAA